MGSTGDDRYEVVKGDGPEGGFVELWDRALEPSGLALEAIERDGKVVVFGHATPVPLLAVEQFLQDAKAYLAIA